MEAVSKSLIGVKAILALSRSRVGLVHRGNSAATNERGKMQIVLFIALLLLSCASLAGGLVWSHRKEQEALNKRFPPR